jgi:hypothetical protein
VCNLTCHFGGGRAAAIRITERRSSGRTGRFASKLAETDGLTPLELCDESVARTVPIIRREKKRVKRFNLYFAMSKVESLYYPFLFSSDSPD